MMVTDTEFIRLFEKTSKGSYVYIKDSVVEVTIFPRLGGWFWIATDDHYSEKFDSVTEAFGDIIQRGLIPATEVPDYCIDMGGEY